MKPQTVNVLKEIVRFFIGCYGRGNACTANTSTIHTEVCKQLKITRQANKNNHYGVVVECLRVLKRKVVLFETMTPKENDVLNKSIAVDNRAVYGLTNAVEDYLTRPETPGETPISITSDRYVTSLLQHFDVLPKPHDIRVEEPPQEETGTMTGDNNVERLVATIKNISKTWMNRSTPADLLGGLYAYGAFDAAHHASAAKLGWQPKSHKHSRAAKILARHGLVAWGGARPRTMADGRVTECNYGIHLTPLGIEVAIAGGFKDERPEGEIFDKVPELNMTISQKTGPMLKNQKQEESLTPAVAAQAAASADMTLMREIAALRERLAVLETKTAAVEEKEELPAAAPKPHCYSDVATAAIVLSHVVPAISAAVNKLIDPPETEDPTTGVNSDGLYVALTELEKIVHGVKAYVSECIAEGTHVDQEQVARYADDCRRAAENLDGERRIPLMGSRLMTKRYLAGDEAITRYIWRSRVRA